MLAAFDNKNPSIKSESSLFLARALCHTQPAAFNKKLIKAYVAGLLKLIESAGMFELYLVDLRLPPSTQPAQQKYKTKCTSCK